MLLRQKTVARLFIKCLYGRRETLSGIGGQAMADNRKYYYLKLKEGFFESDELKILQSMPDGYLYSDILLKLYLKSLRNNGKLMYRDVIPYTSEILATLTGHQVGTVEKAIETLQKLGLVEILDNGAIYIMDIQNFIGQSSTEADRQREYYNAIKAEKARILGENDEKSCKKSNENSLPEIRERERDKDKELETDIITVSKDTVSRTDVQRAVEAWNALSIYGIKQISKLTSGTKRADSLTARIKEYGIEEVIAAIEKIKNSDFLRGKNNRGWVITFDWFVLPNNFPKVHDGNYDSNKPNNNVNASTVEQFAERAQRWAEDD